MIRAALGRGVVELPVDRIGPRPHNDTRTPDPAAVLALAESISSLGLLEPIVVDNRGSLVAGRTRLEALRLLLPDTAEGREAMFGLLLQAAGRKPDEQASARVRALTIHPSLREGRVPVRVLDFDASQDREQALSAEIAENEHRRDYTRKEIEQLASRLRSAGFVDRPGRPRKGEKALKPALGAILGKSRRTIERLLSGEPERRGRPRLNAEGGRRTLVLSVDVELERAVKSLAKKKGWPVSAVARDALRAGLPAIDGAA